MTTLMSFSYFLLADLKVYLFWLCCKTNGKQLTEYYSVLQSWSVLDHLNRLFQVFKDLNNIMIFFLARLSASPVKFRRLDLW